MNYWCWWRGRCFCICVCLIVCLFVVVVGVSGCITCIQIIFVVSFRTRHLSLLQYSYHNYFIKFILFFLSEGGGGEVHCPIGCHTSPRIYHQSILRWKRTGMGWEDSIPSSSSPHPIPSSSSPPPLSSHLPLLQMTFLDAFFGWPHRKRMGLSDFTSAGPA